MYMIMLIFSDSNFPLGLLFTTVVYQCTGYLYTTIYCTRIQAQPHLAIELAECKVMIA